MKSNRRTLQKEQTFHHNVCDFAARHCCKASFYFAVESDAIRSSLAYVGMTGIPVDHRFENHKHGYKSAWVVRDTASD
jgi:hypothetical protein